MEVTGQHNAPATLSPGNNTSIHSAGGGVSSRTGLEDLEMRKIAGLRRDLNTGSSSLYPCLYTDNAVPAPLIRENNLFSNVYLLFFKTLSLRNSTVTPSYYQLISGNISFHCLVDASISVLVTTMATQNRCNLLQLCEKNGTHAYLYGG